jgi:ribosomal protein L40E
MQSLRELLSRFCRWRAWRALLRRSPVASATDRPRDLTASRPILRHVSRHGVRVYSLCVSCGAHLSASATLCDACARSRSLPNS